MSKKRRNVTNVTNPQPVQALFRRSAHFYFSKLRFSVVWLGQIQNLELEPGHDVLGLEFGSERLWLCPFPSHNSVRERTPLACRSRLKFSISRAWFPKTGNQGSQCSGAFFGWVVTYRCGLLEKLLEKLALFEKFWSRGKEEARSRGGIMENRIWRSGGNYIFCINSFITT